VCGERRTIEPHMRYRSRHCTSTNADPTQLRRSYRREGDQHESPHHSGAADDSAHSGYCSGFCSEHRRYGCTVARGSRQRGHSATRAHRHRSVGAERGFPRGHATGTQNYVCLPSGAGVAWTLFTTQATLFSERGRQLTTHFFSPDPLEAGRPVRATWQDSEDTSTVWVG
jgi:hypothetical protein